MSDIETTQTRLPVITNQMIAQQDISTEAQLGKIINVCMEKIAAERDALLAVLSEIVYEYRNSYDADCEPGGSWKGAASIPYHVMAEAERLVSK